MLNVYHYESYGRTADITGLNGVSPLPSCLTSLMPAPLPIRLMMGGRLRDGTFAVCGGKDDRLRGSFYAVEDEIALICVLL